MSFSLDRVLPLPFTTHHVKWPAKKKEERILMAFRALALVALQGCKFMGGLARSEIAMRLPAIFSRCTHKYRTKNIFN